MICHCLFTKNSLFARNVIQKYSFFSIFHQELPKKAHKTNDFRKNPPVPYPYETKHPLCPSIPHSLCSTCPVHHRFTFYGEQPLSGHRAAVERPCTVLQATVRGFWNGPPHSLCPTKTVPKRIFCPTFFPPRTKCLPQKITK